MATKERSSVYSMRFSEKDMALLKTLTERQGVSMSDLIREALATLAAAQREPTVELSTPPDTRVFVYHGEPAHSSTKSDRTTTLVGATVALT